MGCTGTDKLPEVSAESITYQGTFALPSVVWPESPRAVLQPGEVHRYNLPLNEGATVAIRVQPAEIYCAIYTPLAILRAPDGTELVASSGRGKACSEGAFLQYTVESAGTYQMLVTALDLPGAYRLDASCVGDNDCTPENATFAASRVASSSTAAELNDVGSFLFEHVYQVDEGLGNGDGDARPGMNQIHNGPRGGPDSQSCVGCHNAGFVDGAGALDDNIYQAGDGINAASALKRNPMALRGSGVREAIARELSAALQDAFDAMTEPGELCVDTLDDTLCFGSVEFSRHGKKRLVSALVDPDLIIKPFGWKGREATLRGFVKGGFRVHFGMQTEGAIRSFCERYEAGQTTDEEKSAYEAAWGEARDACEDPDNDGVVSEITEGQLTAMGVYLQLIAAPPFRALASDDRARATFDSIGCSDCHTERFAVRELSWTDPDTGVRVELPRGSGDGSNEFSLWSDFRRHDLGNCRADVRDFTIDTDLPPIAARRFLTAPLWDLASSAPYMHDGKSPTVHDAIRAHECAESEGNDAVRAYRDLPPARRAELLVWLEALGA